MFRLLCNLGSGQGNCLKVEQGACVGAVISFSLPGMVLRRPDIAG